jgi:hypothetical protein
MKDREIQIIPYAELRDEQDRTRGLPQDLSRDRMRDCSVQTEDIERREPQVEERACSLQVRLPISYNQTFKNIFEDVK